MNRIISTVIVGLVGLNAVMQAGTAKPKLIVGIMVDQLRTDYIDYLRDMFGDRGFKLLVDSGLTFRNIDFSVGRLNSSVATAEVMTGAYPRTNGVTASVTAGGTLSPEALKVSTLADEVAIDGGGMANIYVIAPDEATAVALAGHSANGAVWLDQAEGRWTSSSYYGTLPQAAQLRNGNNPLKARIDTMAWKPALPLDRYPGVPPQKKFYPFRYSFPRSDRDAFRRFARTPLVNREVTDIAIDVLKGLKLGNRGSEATDMLGIGYTAAPYKEAADGSYRLELADSYIRLDGQLERLIDAIDRNVGLDNTLLFVSSTGYCDEAVADDPKFRIPGGEISLKRMRSLVNSFLSAKYGNADYVSAIKDDGLFIDEKTIEDKKLSRSAVIADLRVFLSKMSGISKVYTLDEILEADSPETRALQLGTDPDSAADLTLEYQPGWTVCDDLTFPVVKKVIRHSATATPAFIVGPGVQAERIDVPVDATGLAGTVAGILRIRSPNAAGRPVR